MEWKCNLFLRKEKPKVIEKQVDKKIEQLEKQKSKELVKLEKIRLIVNDYDNQIKELQDFKKEQEKINKKQEELNKKIQETVQKQRK